VAALIIPKRYDTKENPPSHLRGGAAPGSRGGGRAGPVRAPITESGTKGWEKGSGGDLNGENAKPRCRPRDKGGKTSFKSQRRQKKGKVSP